MPKFTADSLHGRQSIRSMPSIGGKSPKGEQPGDFVEKTVVLLFHDSV